MNKWISVEICKDPNCTSCHGTGIIEVENTTSLTTSKYRHFSNNTMVLIDDVHESIKLSSGDKAIDNVMEDYDSMIESKELSIDEELDDSKMLNWLQQIMTDKDDYCEVFFAGLRNGNSDADSFQIESNPEKFKTIAAKSLREVISLAMQEYPKQCAAIAQQHTNAKLSELEKLISALEKYNKCLTDELNDVVSIAFMHGWKSNRFKEGESLRQEISKLKEKIN